MSQEETAQAPEYLLYLRKSNGRKAVPRQRAITTAYIRDHGGVVSAEFKDDDRTAWHGKGERPTRDDFDRMLDVLRSRKGLRVAAWHADRLTRNDHDTAELIRVCRAGGHLIETPRGGAYDMGNANGRKRFRDDASDAIYEVDHLQERVLAGRDDVAADGRWLGGKRPFGWRLDENPADSDGESLLDEDGEPLNGVLVLDDAEARAIREACESLLTGATQGAIARQWNAAGLTGTSGAKWAGNEVRRVLLRPRNAGLMEHRGQITGRASWPPIVDEMTWRRVCAVLADPDRKTTPGPDRKHLLSGIARCAECGAGLVCSTTGSGRGRKRAVYICRQRATDGAHVARDAASIDAYIADVVIARLEQPDAASLLMADAAAELPALYREKTALADAMKASNDLRRQGLLTPAEFAAERREHQADEAALEAKITAAEQADVVAPLLGVAREAWPTLTLEQQRAIIDALLEITVHPQPKGRPKGWKPGQPYFDFESVQVDWRRG